MDIDVIVSVDQSNGDKTIELVTADMDESDRIVDGLELAAAEEAEEYGTDRDRIEASRWTVGCGKLTFTLCGLDVETALTAAADIWNEYGAHLDENDVLSEQQKSVLERLVDLRTADE